MAARTSKRFRMNGPWKGINERVGEAGPNELEDAWNVEFDGENIVSRGRQVAIATYHPFKPTAILFPVDLSTANRASVDFYETLTDDAISTYVNLDYKYAPLPNLQLNLGFDRPVCQIRVECPDGNAGPETSCTVYLMNNLIHGLSDNLVTLDTTLGLKTSGTIYLSEAIQTAFGYYPHSISDAVLGVTPHWHRGDFRKRLYWYVLMYTATGPANVSSIAGIRISGDYEINGIHALRRSDGSRPIIIGCDGSTTGIPGVFVMDVMGGDTRWKPINVSGGATFGTDPGCVWRFASLDNSLVACNGYALFWTHPDDISKAEGFSTVNVIDTTLKQSPPQDAKLVVVHDRCLAVVTRDKPNTVLFSKSADDRSFLSQDAVAPLNGLHVWDADATATFSDVRGGLITAMASYAGRLVVFTPTSTHEFVGSGYGATASRVVDGQIGCVSPATVAVSPVGLFFLSSGGVYCYDGTSLRCVSNNIPRTMGSLNMAALWSAAAVVYRAKSQYRLYVPSGMDRLNDIALVYNYEHETWTKFGFPEVDPGSVSTGYRTAPYYVSYAVTTVDSDYREQIIESSSDTIYQADCVGQGISFPVLIRFNRIALDEQAPGILRAVRTNIMTEGPSRSVSVIVEADGGATRSTSTITLGDDSEDSTTQTFSYNGTGGAVLGTSAWVAPRLTSKGAKFGESGRTFQVILERISATMAMVLRGIEVEIEPTGTMR